MLHPPDYLIIGSGLTGATIARLLTDQGYRVLVLERRKHLGGNVHCSEHESGIRFHTYGPHYFRTSSPRIWAFVNRFAAFYPYEACLKTLVNGRLENWPISAEYIQRAVGQDWKPSFSGLPANFEEAALALMPRLVYEKFVKGYTRKQWGVEPGSLSPDLISRFDVRTDNDPRLKPRHQYQGLPVDGYTAMMRQILTGIEVLTGVDYLQHRQAFQAKKMTIFTGPIDEYFGFDMGKLAYRGQVRAHAYLREVTWYQPCAQVNNPDESNGPYIRTLEWKHLLPPRQATAIAGTLITTETPFSPEDPDQYEYPFPDAANHDLFKRYQERAAAIPDLLICGRLGEYRYYDMDQAIGRAMVLAGRLMA